jgi:phosphoribosyl-ATP pyrophosphohydrolase
MNMDSYSGKMQRNPQLALMKIMEECWEIVADHEDNQISECSDLFVHLIMYTSKPKDMMWLLASKRVTHILTYENTAKNYPEIYSVVHEIIDPTICFAFICRKGACIEPQKYGHIKTKHSLLLNIFVK